MDVKEEKQPDPVPQVFTKNKILKDTERGQHKGLTVTASNYDEIVTLCKGRKILKAKRLPYNTHSPTCAWVNTAHREIHLPCNCYYFGSNKDTTLPEFNQWEITVMG